MYCKPLMTFQAAVILFAATPALSAGPYKEAPMLAVQVAAGKLPPVETRLPEDPRVIDPVEKVGEYGGTWRSGLRGGGDRNWLFRLLGYEPLVAWDRNFTGKIVPNVASRFSASDDGKEFTFRLRRGMKWSDGSPFTADDVVFFINDIARNKELLPIPPEWLALDGQPPTIEKIDEITFKLKYAKPYGMFLLKAASNAGIQITMMPKRYCSQFHPGYNAAKLPELMKEAGVTSWTALFIKKCALDVQAAERWQNPDRPTLEAWRIRQPYVGGATVVTLERNPFYFKVDSAGQQLPYIDGHRMDVGAEVQTLVLKALNGEIDYQDRHINSNANKAVFVENMKKGNYRLVELPNASMNTVGFCLNLTHKDPVKRQLYSNLDFRIGLSHAIDRKAIIDSVFIGEGEPRQLAPHPSMAFHNKQLASQYLAYDVATANKYLDKVAPRKDSEGMRLGPDGKRISVVLLTIAAVGDYVDAMQLVTRYWKAVGIDAQVQVVDRTLFYERKDKNDADGIAYAAEGGLIDGMLDPRWYFPYSNESNFATLWANWYMKVQPNEEPPAAVKRQMQLYGQIKEAVDPARQQALFGELLQIAADQFYAFGISAPGPLYAVVKNNMRNVPSVPWSWQYPSPAPSNTEQYYFAR